MKTALSIFFGFGLAYLIGSFVCWDFNAGNWHPIARFITMFLGAAVTGIIENERE